jgi:polyhydroxyalkanoate synthesis regulator phasin
MIRNLRRPADYQKAVMTQDQLLKIAVANDSNIANARRSYQQGEIMPLTPQQSATAVELQEDTGKNESDALNNLLTLGFRYDEASQIVNDMTYDEKVIMNNTFPAVKADFLKKFVVSRTTPTAFVEYIRKYVEIFRVSKGIDNPGALFNDKFDALINNIDDIRAILPPPAQIAELSAIIRGLPNIEDIQQRLSALASTLPNERFFKILQNENEQLQYETLDMLQNITANLPTRQEFQGIIDDLKAGRLTQDEAREELRDLIGAVDRNTIEGLQEVRRDIEVAVGELSPAPSYIDPTSIDLSQPRPTKATLKKYIERLTTLDPNITAGAGNTPAQITKSRASAKAWLEANDARIKLLLGVGVAVVPGGAEATPIKEGKSGHGIRTKKIGRGVAVQEAPTYRQFGKYVIHQNQLLNNDMLNVKYPSLGRIPQFKPTTISDPTKEFIIDLLDTGKANQRVYETLPKEERKLFEKIATGAGIFHHLKLKKTITDDEAKDYERFQVLRGEYFAGNNSQALMKELRRLIVKFMNDGRIHKSEGTNLLMELSI